MVKTPLSDIQYNHDRNMHSLEGPQVALPRLLDGNVPVCMLDVGCGTGTWMRSALDLGVSEVSGLDGVALSPGQLCVPKKHIQVCNLLGDWGIQRSYDLVISFEVAEHLPPEAAEAFIQKLTACGNRIFFSAANGWQRGQNHLNCQWPSYWQRLFNQHEFVCRDTLRWRIWDDTRIEPWYRQNMFLAERDQVLAGTEPRIPGVIHPDYMSSACEQWRLSQRSLLEAFADGLNRLTRRRRPSDRPSVDGMP